MPLFFVLHNDETDYLTDQTDNIAHALSQPSPLCPVSLVAVVRCPDLGDVFGLTNTHHGDWWNNPEVLAFREARSLSIGDVVITEEGEIYTVAPNGYGRVPGSLFLHLANGLTLANVYVADAYRPEQRKGK